MTELMCKLDWFSFTFPCGLQGEKDNEYTLSSVLLAFHDYTAHRFLGTVTNALWQWVPTAGFYDHKIQCPRSLISISWKSGNPYALCELSGLAVDKVLHTCSIRNLALAAGERTTRIDLAIDIETDITPAEFCAVRGETRHTSKASYETETGLTNYIGSRSGDRMARVYRFFLPHPRSHLLRVEAEYKGDAAKLACSRLLEASLTEVTLSAHLPFAWQHPIYVTGDAEISKIPARGYDTVGAGTLKWLEETVVPAIKKSAETGLIDLDEWLKKHFKKD